MSQDIIELTLDARQVTGKQVKRIRQQGLVPAVIHDHGKASVVVQGAYQDIVKTYSQAGKHHPVRLKAAGKTFTALIKDIEYEPRHNSISHVVFNAVTANEIVEAEVPVHARYQEGNEASPAERAGLMVLSNLTVVSVQATPSNLPDVLYYDAEKLVSVGDRILVEDLVVPAGVEVLTDGAQAVASVYEPSAVAAANDALGGAAEAGEEAAVESQQGAAEPEAAAETAA